jgi:hypothetical protein
MMIVNFRQLKGSRFRVQGSGLEISDLQTKWNFGCASWAGDIRKNRAMQEIYEKRPLNVEP